MATTYYWIKVPKKRDIVDPTTPDKKVLMADYSFFKFLILNILADKRFAANWKTIRTAGEIEDQFEEATEGSWQKIHATARDLMKHVCEEPSQPFLNPHLLTQCGDMFEAIVEAPDKDPTAPAEDGESAA